MEKNGVVSSFMNSNGVYYATIGGSVVISTNKELFKEIVNNAKKNGSLESFGNLLEDGYKSIQTSGKNYFMSCEECIELIRKTGLKKSQTVVVSEEKKGIEETLDAVVSRFCVKAGKGFCRHEGPDVIGHLKVVCGYKNEPIVSKIMYNEYDAVDREAAIVKALEGFSPADEEVSE